MSQVNIILSGCGGRMGRTVAEIVAERNDCRIAAGIDIFPVKADFPVYSSPAECDIPGDVIIDFSRPEAMPELIELARSGKLSLVLCTTGYSEAQILDIKAAARDIPVFFSGNMSLGINLLIELSKKAAAVLGGTFDIEIVEKHHNQKVDAPSGTALMLADAVTEALSRPVHYEYDRHSRRAKRDRSEIGIHAVRGGTIVGDHDVIFAGHDEVVTLSHSAHSKGVFAAGAVNAAVFMTGQAPGLYTMAELVASS